MFKKFLPDWTRHRIITYATDMGILRTMAYFLGRYRNKKMTAVST